ncbi:Heparin-binding growth factor [Apis cerana cerana]|uniref:Fibroblast growth factor n=1 Tax=Apis cerana cerana TaxID=94128 RepID=A0A2A3EL06_APICC|nr:Heparin-binding growth factor [Apis cerana cerana]
MSLRWIHENLEAPTCDEECSDIDDSCSDDSYDSDLSIGEEKGPGSEKEINGDRRRKRETRRHPTTTVKFDENGCQDVFLVKFTKFKSKIKRYDEDMKDIWIKEGYNIIHKQYNSISSNFKNYINLPVHIKTSHYITSESVKRSPCVIWDPRKPAQNPVYNCLVIKLFCRTGYHLGVSESGRVRGLSATNEPHALLHIIPVTFGVVRIQNIETSLYLAFNKKGRLYGELNGNKDNTEWEQWNVGSYDAFRSRKYANYGWWIGIKKNGRAKPGPRTSWGQKSIQFLAIRQE